METRTALTTLMRRPVTTPGSLKTTAACMTRFQDQRGQPMGESLPSGHSGAEEGVFGGFSWSASCEGPVTLYPRWSLSDWAIPDPVYEVACKQRLVFLTVPEGGHLRSECQHGQARALNPVLCPHMLEGARELRGVAFIRALIPFMSAPPSPSQHLLKAPPHTITQGIGL